MSESATPRGTAYKKGEASAPSPDAVRDAILRHLYSVHLKAKSPRSAAVGIRDLHKAMKDRHGYKQQDVGSNLDYLLQKGWVVEVSETRTFQTQRGTTQQAPRITYKISDVGVDLLQGASMYERQDVRPHVNITNLHGVTVVGDGNVVNSDFADLSRTLRDLRARVLDSSELDDEAKLNVAADIDTLQTQLQKPTPDRSIMSRAWQAIQVTVTAGEFVELATKAALLITPLLHHVR